MATISRALGHVKAQLDQLICEPDVVRICKRLGHVWRKRLLSPAITVQLFLLQLLAKVAMQGLCRVANLQVTAQAICKAKQRLPLGVLMELVRRSGGSGDDNDDSPPQCRWRGLTVYLADGMSFMIPDTAALAGRFGKPKNQRGASPGYPTPKLLALMDHAGGLIHKVIALPHARQEYTCLSRLFGAIGRASLLLGDRGLVSFPHLAMLIGAGVHGCFRLPVGQVVFNRGTSPRRRLIKRLGRQDMLIRWAACHRPAGWLSKKRWATLSKQELTLRQISYRVCRKGFRTKWAWIVTPLTDPQAYPAQDLIDLYARRWQIEVCFRDLKQTLGMTMISARSVPGVRKEILAFVLLYNLIRRVMQQAAIQQQVEADRIRFIDALRWLLWSQPGDTIPQLKVNPHRVRPTPPRKIKAGQQRFGQLKGSRAALCKPACEAKI